MLAENEPFREPENSIGVLEFLRVAAEYCLFIENTGAKSKDELFNFCLKIGPLLYIKGTLLPVIQPEYPEASERYVTEEEWQEVFNMLRNQIAAHDEFYHVNYEEGPEYEAVKSSLSENFTDIYQDLKDFVLLYQKNTVVARQNAVHDCKTLMARRWGAKLLANLRYLHFLTYHEGEEEY
jgi:hypothetical protein